MILRDHFQCFSIKHMLWELIRIALAMLKVFCLKIHEKIQVLTRLYDPDKFLKSTARDMTFPHASGDSYTVVSI